MTIVTAKRLPLAFFFGIVTFYACGARPSRPAGVLLITLDTTRADHLGCYGDASAVTPNLDALAKESVQFDQAMAAVPTTLPSHATMFTGLYPPAHGVRYNGMFRLGEESVTIAESLRAAGFVTGAVPAAFPVNAMTGLAQGFETYRDLFSEPGAKNLPPTAARSAADVTRLGIETIRAAGTKPFFVWLHYYDAHYPYEPPFPFSSTFREHPYDGEIAYVDKQLGELFATLKKDGLWDRIVIIVAGDHGEGLYDHGERMHSQLAYQSTLRVPLLIKAPGAETGAIVREPVSLADVAPTVLELAGLPVSPGLDGISLREALRGGKADTRPIYFETLAGSLNFGWSAIEGVRRGKWKLIRSGDTELYDLDADPRELTDLDGVDASTASDLAALLDESLKRWADTAAPATATQAPVDAEALARLASLGYVGGTVSSARRGGPNPKDLVHLESELLLLQDLMARGQFRQAMLAIPNILKNDPGNRLVLQDAADASAVLGDFAEAERYARAVIAQYPEFLPAVVTLGRIQVAKKDYKAAETVFRSGLGQFPDEPILVYSLALTMIAQGRNADAEPVIVKALAGKNPDPGFHVLHAVCRATAGDMAAAKKDLEQAIAGGYKNVDSLRNEPLLAPLRGIPGFAEIIAPKPSS
jgi:arylsulfatase A-like enzyme